MNSFLIASSQANFRGGVCLFVYTRVIPQTGEAIVSMRSDNSSTLRAPLHLLSDRAAYTAKVRSLITVKRASTSNFMRRLIRLDRETYKRSADVVARGDPAGGDF